MKNSRKLINESIIIGSLWFYLYEEFWFCNVNNYNVYGIVIVVLL